MDWLWGGGGKKWPRSLWTSLQTEISSGAVSFLAFVVVNTVLHNCYEPKRL